MFWLHVNNAKAGPTLNVRSHLIYHPIAFALAALSYIMSVSLHGEAIFSTRLGRFLPREAVEPRGPIVLRSDPEDDLESMIGRLEREFPLYCKKITPPFTIYEYFDHYDCHVLGTGFLLKVLENIAFRNYTRYQRVKVLVDRWKKGKSANLDKIKVAQTLYDIFTQTEIEEHGEDILGDAFTMIGDLMKLALDREGIVTCPFV